MKKYIVLKAATLVEDARILAYRRRDPGMPLKEVAWRLQVDQQRVYRAFRRARMKIKTMVR